MKSIEIREACLQIAPSLEDIILHNSEVTSSTWVSSVETGKSVEFFSLCCLAAGFLKLGIEIKVPELFRNFPDLFYLRNVLPQHHGAQAGHLAAVRSLSLRDRMIGSLTPKFTFESGGELYAIYREGHPIHQMEYFFKKGQSYLQRPDVIISKGKTTIQNCDDSKIDFNFEFKDEACAGVLRIKNDIVIPLISYSSDLSPALPIAGIVECSVGKTDQRADSQLKSYLNLFNSNVSPISLLINGRHTQYPSYTFDAFLDFDMFKTRKFEPFLKILNRFCSSVVDF